MALIKILKNNSGAELQILNRQVANADSYNVPYGQFTKLADSEYIVTLVTSGGIIVNNGTLDLASSDAIAYLKLMEAPSPGMSFSKVDTYLEVPINRQMIVYQEIEMLLGQELAINGELVLIE
jgi:hypothetical protein